MEAKINNMKTEMMDKMNKIKDSVSKTEAKMAEINDSVYKTEVKMTEINDIVSKMEVKMTKINDSVSQIKIDMNNTKNEIIAKIKEQEETLHNFGRERATYLSSVSQPLTIGQQNGTLHFLSVNGRIYPTTVNFSDRSNKTRLHKSKIWDLSFVKDYDCPDSAIELTSTKKITMTRLGNEVLAYGFGPFSKLWRGHVVDKNISLEVNKPGKLFAFQSGGAQHFGMSGAAILNGCGYVGMAFASGTQVNISLGLAYGISSYNILEEIKKNTKRYIASF